MIDETDSKVIDDNSDSKVIDDNSDSKVIDDDSGDTAEKFDVIYSCLRCATKVSNSELSSLPEIKCICGFRVFTKMRSPVVKTVKAI